MKKTLLLLVAALATFQVSFAQERVTEGKRKFAPVTANRKAPSTPTTSSVPFWTDDFSTPANWTISNQVSNSDDWIIGTNGPAGQFAIDPIASTTATNGFALFDSDLLCSGNQIADLTTANAINCTGQSPVQLQFEQWYTRFDDSTIVFVSNDNINWTAFPVNTTILNNQSPLVNPDVVKLDITSVAGNQATVWIRFEFYSPSTFVGPGNAPGCGYAWMIDDVELSVACAPSTASTATPIVCPGSTAAISVAASPGQTYQWEESTDNITWTPVAGATSPVYNATVTGDIYYRVIGNCGSGLTTTSDPVQLTLNPTAPYCFCIPTNIECDGVDYISEVSITGTTLSYSSICDTFQLAANSNYTFIDPSTATATLTAGSTYDLNVTTTGDHIISVWFDYNHNGAFAATPSEWKQVATTSVAGVANTVSFTVPATALNGATGMRIRSRFSGNPNTGASACINMGSGETEDYFVTITGGVGIEENAFANASIKPSVTSDIFSIDLGTANLNNARLSVFNLQGQAVINNQDVTTQRFDVSLGAFEPGLYLVRVYNADASFTGRVTVVK